MRFASPRELFGTLHFRLTVWNTVTVLLMVVVTLLGVREGLRLALLHETDQMLQDDALEMALDVQEYWPDQELIHHELERKASTHAHSGLFVQMVDGEGRVRWQTLAAPSEQPWTGHKARSARPFTSGDFRLVERPVPFGGRSVPEAHSVRLGSSLVPLREDVNKLTQMMLLVGAVILMISPLGGYWLAGRATRPLAEIIDTTARLHPANLEERLQLRGTRDELDRLSQTINGFLDRIAAYLNQNREFTANAAHELRSPLAAIQSSLEVAINAERTSQEYKELIGETLEECGLLRDLVNQMLLLAESDAGELEIGPNAIALDHVIQKACEMFAGVAEAADTQFVVGRLESVQIYGDANRLRQVINNLLDNAIKFTRGGRISVALFTNTDRKVVLQVADTGSGIAPDDLPHVFERFYRGDKSRHRKDRGAGTGLGLSICQSIVAAHGGEIMIQSTPGQGTTVTVILPAASADGRREIGLPLKSVETSSVA
jgi:heavy metal sensor kinase